MSAVASKRSNGDASQQSSASLECNGDAKTDTPKTKPSTAKFASSSSPATTSSSSPSSSRLVFGLSNRTNKLKHDEYAASRFSQSQANSSNSHSNKSSSAAPKSDQQQATGSVKEVPATKPFVRASKYGNHYRPIGQEVLDSDKSQPLKVDNKECKMVEPQKSSDKSPSSTLKQQQQQQHQQSPEVVGKRTTTTTTSAKARSRSKSPDKRKLNEDSEKRGQVSRSRNDESPETKPIKPQPPPKNQFNIPPPPRQVSRAISGKGSVVSYAKARIYDRPKTQMGAQFREDGSLELADGLPVPKSISCGFKPPKQVNVSKACSIWEGGEPFAKCKSRQRLAAQAGKRLLHGTWSMTSVVATQQFQLQQALAQSSGYTRPQQSSLEPVVKVLTRGSVFERVQQFEKAPSISGSTGSDSSLNSSLSSSSSLESQATDSNDTDDEVSLTINEPIATSRTSCSDTADIGGSVSLQPTNKRALYKSKVSTLVQQQQTDPLASPPVSTATRRLSLRRRSSSTSSTQSIPKFYHPNGKPNTYEMEVQKRNIVACFDKLPDRRASLQASSATARRHFHSIALACGFSEYFKEPLRAYVGHQLETNPNLALTTQTNGQQNNGVSRKQSVIGLPNGFSRDLNTTQTTTSTTNKQPLKTINKSASLDTSTLELKKTSSNDSVTCDQFLNCWRKLISSAYDQAARFVHLMTLGQRQYLLPEDFVTLMQSIIDDHPGLKFLRAAPDFHMRYIQTVIARIYYCINKSWTGKITLNELRHSNLLAVLQVLSQEDDINQITDYFSYEHFYVIYCKFWNLDQDHDLLISKEDLARHNDAAISSRIIERIFSGIVSKQIQQTGKMSYTDFVWFLLAEEDKKHPRAIEYWFRLMDMDGDGYISMYEMEYFYYEQMKRLELMNIEALPFIDSACQILDLVNPVEKNKISLSDLKRTKMATIFFDTFINLEKYLEHESREFVSTRDVIQDGCVISDWDRYASEEYESLVTEESSV